MSSSLLTTFERYSAPQTAKDVAWSRQKSKEFEEVVRRFCGQFWKETTSTSSSSIVSSLSSSLVIDQSPSSHILLLHGPTGCSKISAARAILLSMLETSGNNNNDVDGGSKGVSSSSTKRATTQAPFTNQMWKATSRLAPAVINIDDDTDDFIANLSATATNQVFAAAAGDATTSTEESIQHSQLMRKRNKKRRTLRLLTIQCRGETISKSTTPTQLPNGCEVVEEERSAMTTSELREQLYNCLAGDDDNTLSTGGDYEKESPTQQQPVVSSSSSASSPTTTVNSNSHLTVVFIKELPHTSNPGALAELNGLLRQFHQQCYSMRSSSATTNIIEKSVLFVFVYTLHDSHSSKVGLRSWLPQEYFSNTIRPTGSQFIAEFACRPVTEAMLLTQMKRILTQVVGAASFSTASLSSSSSSSSSDVIRRDKDRLDWMREMLHNTGEYALAHREHSRKEGLLLHSSSHNQTVIQEGGLQSDGDDEDGDIIDLSQRNMGNGKKKTTSVSRKPASKRSGSSSYHPILVGIANAAGGDIRFATLQLAWAALKRPPIPFSPYTLGESSGCLRPQSTPINPPNVISVDEDDDVEINRAIGNSYSLEFNNWLTTRRQDIDNNKDKEGSDQQQGGESWYLPPCRDDYLDLSHATSRLLTKRYTLGNVLSVLPGNGDVTSSSSSTSSSFCPPWKVADYVTHNMHHYFPHIPTTTTATTSQHQGSSVNPSQSSIATAVRTSQSSNYQAQPSSDVGTNNGIRAYAAISKAASDVDYWMGAPKPFLGFPSAPSLDMLSVGFTGGGGGGGDDTTGTNRTSSSSNVAASLPLMGLAIVVAAYRALHTTMQVPKVFLSLRPPPYIPSAFPKIAEGGASSSSSAGWKRGRGNNDDFMMGNQQQQQYHGGGGTTSSSASSVLVHHDYTKELEGFEEYLTTKGATSSSFGGEGGEGSGGGGHQLSLPQHFGTVRKLVTTSVANSECSSSVEGTLDFLHGLPAIFIALPPTTQYHGNNIHNPPSVTTQVTSFISKPAHGTTTTLLSRPQSTTTLLGRPKPPQPTTTATTTTSSTTSQSTTTTPQQMRGRVTTLLTRSTPTKLSQLSQPLPQQSLLPPPPPSSAVEGVVAPLASLLRHQRQQQQRMGSAGNDVAMGELLSVRRVGGRVQPHQISVQQQQQRRYGGMMTRPSLVSLSVHTRFQVVPLQSSAWQRIYLSHNNTNATTSRSSGHGRDFADVFDMEILMPAAAASSSYTVGTAQSTVAPPSSGRWITLEGGSNQRWSGGQNNTSNGGDGSVLLVSDDCVPLGLGMFIPRGPNNVSSNPYMSASSITQQQHGLDEIESVSDSD